MNDPTARIATSAALLPMELGTTALRAWTAYWAGTLRRGAGPWDVLNDGVEVARVLTARGEPGWAHANAVRRSWPLARLRDFSAPDSGTATPVLVLPPVSGWPSALVDLVPGHSQVEALRSAGLGRIFVLDWLAATPDTAGSGAADYLALVSEAVADLGGRVHLVGDSQGGLLGVIHAALHPETAVSLTLAGTSIDFHAGFEAWDALVDLLPGGATELRRSARTLSSGAARYWWDGAIHSALSPLTEIERILQLVAEVPDPDAVRYHVALSKWAASHQPAPEAFRRWAVDHLLVGNELALGSLEVGGRVVDLERIDCPLVLVAGTRDSVAAQDEVWALAGRVCRPGRAGCTG